MDYHKIILYIIESYEKGELVSVVDASRRFDCSVSSIRKYIAKLKKSDSKDDIDLYNRYINVSHLNQENGRKIGGQKGKRKSSLSIDEVRSLCDSIIENDCTLRELSKESGIRKSTLYENLSRLGDSRLSDVFSKHRRCSSNDYNNDLDNNSSFDEVGSEISKRCTRKK